MDKRQYFIILYILLLADKSVIASPWPVQEGRYLAITEFQKTNAAMERSVVQE